MASGDHTFARIFLLLLATADSLGLGWAALRPNGRPARGRRGIADWRGRPSQGLRAGSFRLRRLRSGLSGERGSTAPDLIPAQNPRASRILQPKHGSLKNLLRAGASMPSARL